MLFPAARGAVALAFGLCLVAPAMADPCGSDLDGSGAVDGADLGVLVSLWGRCADCPADLNSDGVVDAADLGLLLGDWGPVPVFDYGPDYPDAEAWQIALETLGPAGSLSAPPDLYDRIDRDLELIRAAEPALVGQTHSPAWLANHLIVKVLDGADLGPYECLNSFYQVQSAQFLFSSGGGKWYVLVYSGNLNVEALVPVYQALAAVPIAEPDGLFGGQNYWTPAPGDDGTWTWSIDDGFTDCFDGCDCHRYYTFSVTEAGGVELLDYVEVGPSYCGF